MWAISEASIRKLPTLSLFTPISMSFAAVSASCLKAAQRIHAADIIGQELLEPVLQWRLSLRQPHAFVGDGIGGEDPTGKDGAGRRLSSPGPARAAWT